MKRWMMVALPLALFGCGEASSEEPPAAPTDTSVVDIAADAGQDAAPADIGEDAALEVAEDTEPVDVTQDAGEDAADGAEDAPPDLGPDVEPDIEPDVEPDVEPDAGCLPACDGKACGDDGCGGVCGVCAESDVCGSTGQCSPCGDCYEGLVCGATDLSSVYCAKDGCGDVTSDGFCEGDVFVTCYEGILVSADCPNLGMGACGGPGLGCVPVADCEGKICGPDGVGGACGACETGLFCSIDGTTCEDAQASCGECLLGTTCSAEPGFEHDCTKMGCDGLTGDGYCVGDTLVKCLGETLLTADCTIGAFEPMTCGLIEGWGHGCVPKPDCTGKECSNDEVCGVCEAGLFCSAEGQCVTADEFCGQCAPGTKCGGVAGYPTYCSADGTKDCGGLSYEGICDENGLLVFCSYGVLTSADCSKKPGNATVCMTDPIALANSLPYADCFAPADCTGKECGWDGSFGTCGTCPIDQGCTPEGKCVDATATPGDSCTNAIPVGPLPFTASGDSTGLTNSTALPSACKALIGTATADVMYAFAPAATGAYTMTLAPGAVDGTPFAFLYVVETCAGTDATCHGFTDVWEQGIGSSVTLQLHAGSSYTIVVELTEPGSYTLAISEPCAQKCEGKACGDDGCGATCGACAEGSTCGPENQCVAKDALKGNTCTDPFPIAQVPFAAEGSTADASQEFVSSSMYCPGIPTYSYTLGADEVYAFTPALEGVYSIELKGGMHIVYVTEGCVTSAYYCMGSQFAGAGPLYLALAAGKAYNVVVDSHPASSGPYTLSIDLCTPSCEGKACGSDGCGGSCGTCDAGTVCGPAFACVPDDPASCLGQCGGSGGSCDCDALCNAWGSCCPDACAVCGDAVPEVCVP